MEADSLDDIVEIVQSHVGSDRNPPPNRRLGPKKRDFEDVGGVQSRGNHS